MSVSAASAYTSHLQFKVEKVSNFIAQEQKTAKKAPMKLVWKHIHVAKKKKEFKFKLF